MLLFIYLFIYFSEIQHSTYVQDTPVQSKSEWCNKTQECTNNYTIKRKRK